MRNLIGDRKGISMMEVLVSVALISIGVLGLVTLLPSGWKLSGTSDMLGRAAGILQAELEANEILIMNENNPVTPTPPGNPPKKPVYGSGSRTLQPGDIAYSVQTERTDLGGSWMVRVQVTWPNNPVGISESVIVTRQKAFIQ
jgi:Tfp pilus assembly protein PilV